MGEAIEIPRAEPDLIDRIAVALPEEVRAEYYRELRHCRSLPENDEMLRLLRAMQFLVLLIEQAPSRVADERERIDKLLASAVEKISKMSAGIEVWNREIQRRLLALPGDVGNGIRPEAIAREINENLRQTFLQSTIPQTADALSVVAGEMKKVCSEFSSASDDLGNVYRGAAEDARKAVGSLKSEIDQASKTAARFTGELAEKFSKAYRWSMCVLAGGALIMGLALGMMFERWLFFPPERVVTPTAGKTEAATPGGQPASQPAQGAPPAVKSGNEK